MTSRCCYSVKCKMECTHLQSWSLLRTVTPMFLPEEQWNSLHGVKCVIPWQAARQEINIFRDYCVLMWDNILKRPRKTTKSWKLVGVTNHRSIGLMSWSYRKICKFDAGEPMRATRSAVTVHKISQCRTRGSIQVVVASLWIVPHHTDCRFAVTVMLLTASWQRRTLRTCLIHHPA
jgi:hypothetical protein